MSNADHSVGIPHMTYLVHERYLTRGGPLVAAVDRLYWSLRMLAADTGALHARAPLRHTQLLHRCLK